MSWIVNMINITNEKIFPFKLLLFSIILSICFGLGEFIFIISTNHFDTVISLNFAVFKLSIGSMLWNGFTGCLVGLLTAILLKGLKYTNIINTSSNSQLQYFGMLIGLLIFPLGAIAMVFINKELLPWLPLNQLPLPPR